MMNKEDFIQKIPVETVFLCILQMMAMSNTSPVPHESFNISTEQQSNNSTERYQREVPHMAEPDPGFVGTPLPAISILFSGSFLLPYYYPSLKRSFSPTQHLTPETRKKLWRTPKGSQRVVTCHGDDGHPFDGFPCDDNICVPLHWVCDGETDCEGGSDEAECNNCGRDELNCKVRGVSTCLAPRFLCDGQRDCHDGSDEDPDNCRSACEFHCRDGNDCIAHSLVCDRNQDCFDGSDELNCAHHPPHNDCHPEFEFQCYNSLDSGEWSQCVPRAWLCDDHDDCPHGEDEYVSTCNRK